MIFATPTGTRDILGDELRELRAITDALRTVYENRGYGEVRTPAIERDDVLRTGAGDIEPGYRVIDDHGNVMALRPDMTVPIARVAATRFAGAEPPLRFSYLDNVYRAVNPQRGEARELLQSGIELFGPGAPDGTIEVLSLLCEALSATGLRDFRIAAGSAALFPRLLAAHGVPDDARPELLSALASGDFVRFQAEVGDRGLAQELIELARLRGDIGVLDRLPGDAAAGLRTVLESAGAAVRERVVVDLGLNRGFGYYTGAVFEVLHPANGSTLGGGGRYDDLAARFGRALPAAGFALDVEQLHGALIAEEHSR